MTDLERRLQDSLKSVGKAYDPADAHAARTRFLARRRRRSVALYAGTTIVAGTAAIVAFLFIGTEQFAEKGDKNEVLPVASPTLDAVVTETVAVGDAPSGVGSGAGYIWVANSGDNTVSKVDPATNEVVEELTVPGGPDDVVVSAGYAWVGTEVGSVIAIDTSTGEQRPYSSSTSAHLDMAPAEDGIVAVRGGGAIATYTTDAGFAEAFDVGVDLRDIASGAREIWVYDYGAGNVIRMTRPGIVTNTTPVGKSENADLSVSDDSTWLLLGDSGTLLQIAHDTGEVTTRTELGGTFGAIAEEGGILYVLTTDGGEQGTGEGRLWRIDAASAERIGNPVPLTDYPYDIEASPEGIWVTNNSGDALTRIDLVPKDGSTAEMETPAIAGEILFYFARDGDIFSYDSNGVVAPVIASPAIETSPSVGPDGSLAYQEGRTRSRNVRVNIHGFLEDADTYPIDRGAAPAYSKQGRIAWADRGSFPTTISVGKPGTDDRVSFEADPEWELGPLSVSDIAWSPDGETIYYEGSYEGTTLYSAEVGFDDEPTPAVIATDEEDATYLSPAVHDDGTLAIVKLCCGFYPEFEFTVAELGRLEDGAYTKIAGLDDFGFEPTFDLWIESAGHLQYEADTGWSLGEQRSWLVGDGERLGLINEAGEFDAIDLSGVTHATVVAEPLD